MTKDTEFLAPEADPPPVYSPSPSPEPPQAPGPKVFGFPVTFNMYAKKSWKTLAFKIGEHQEDAAYSLQFKSHGWRLPDISMHRGPDETGQCIALASSTSSWRDGVAITLHATLEREEMHEKLESHTSLTKQVYYFAVATGPGNAEKFEWRSSHGDAVKGLGPGAYKWGWKLVRTGMNKSEGEEVVAVWADSTKLSMTKLAKFQFQGSGATGELGEPFTIMAILSMLRIWEVRYYTQIATAAAA